MLIIGDIMTEDPVTITPNATLRDAVELIAANGISGLPVVDGRRVIGTLSARDIIGFESTMRGVPTQRTEWFDGAAPQRDETLGASEFFVDFWDDAGADTVERIRCSDSPEWDELADHTVADAMSTALMSFSPSDSVATAADYMRSTGAHRAIVLDHGRLVGIITTMDITRAVADQPSESSVEAT